ncbi:hypothetical protein DL95DRAFT_382896 [Leptodontidium sp. 2 PMI_412]|nr:hypothetical protein DL95DRAFT_382896 [Leptodontidium sp. 2 PMI_412]
MSSPSLPSRPPHWAVTRTYRKPYKKSTKGCCQCKARKIKCDEIYPCSNCRKKYVDASCCKYSPGPRNSEATSKSTSQTQSSNASNASRSPIHRSLSVTPVGINSSHLLELRLMHHYTKSVFSRPPQKPGFALYHSLWDFEVPQVAFSSELVLNALLGITSLNLLSLNPNDQTLFQSAWSHFNKAVVLQRTALDQMDRQNAEPMIIAAILLAHFNWLAACNEQTPHPRKLEVETYNMCKGILDLAQESGPNLDKYSAIPEVTVEAPPGSSLDKHFMDAATQDMKNVLDSLDARNIGRDEKDACHKFAEEIVQIYTLIASGCKDNAGLEQKIVTLLHRVPECFVSLLEVDDPTALALLARDVMCLELIEDSSAWWVHGAGNSKVPPKALHGILDTMPVDYKWTMEFPLQVIGREVQINHNRAMT